MAYELSFNLKTDDIVALRKKSYASAHKQCVDLNGLDWNWTDSKSMHIGIKYNEELVSCIRVTFFNNFNLLAERLQIHVQEPLCPAPWALLSRASTCPQHKNKNLHTEMRLRALEICQKYNCQSVYGTLSKTSNRLNQLLDLGYCITSEAPNWTNSFLRKPGTVVVVELKKKNLNSAIDKITNNLGLIPLTIPPELPEYL